MNIVITPKKLSGKVAIPPSKSMAHREIICASLAEGKSRIANIAYSDDIIATISCMRSLGAYIKDNPDNIEVNGHAEKRTSYIVFECNESGSTLRFLLPLALVLNNGKNKFVGKGKLGKRPMEIYRDICLGQGIEYIDNSADNPDHFLDLSVQGELKSGDFYIDGGVSSQFISGLLFALPLLQGDSRIFIEGNLQSSGYLDLTLCALKNYSIDVQKEGNVLYVKGNQKYLNHDSYVEGDYSQAAFFEVANYLGSCVDIRGLNKESLQGDKVITEFLQKLKDASPDETLVFDGGNCPDIIPVFALACCLRIGKTQIVNVSRLRIKECDRLHSTVEELKKLGANIEEYNETIVIDGVYKLKGGKVDSHKDHRMAMTLAIAATVCESEVRIKDAECVSKSYPDFYEVYTKLGGEIKEEAV